MMAPPSSSPSTWTTQRQRSSWVRTPQHLVHSLRLYPQCCKRSCCGLLPSDWHLCHVPRHMHAQPCSHLVMGWEHKPLQTEKPRACRSTPAEPKAMLPLPVHGGIGKAGWSCWKQALEPGVLLGADISKTQDAEVGDGTTSVVVLAGELLREAEKLISQKIHPMTIIAGARAARPALLKANRSAEPLS